MIKKMGFRALAVSLLSVACSLYVFAYAPPSLAQIQGDVSVTATVTGQPPSTPAVITSPINGTHVVLTPLVVSGTCAPNLEVRVLNNQALAGTGTCSAEGTFIINIGLLLGRNDLSANNYDMFNRPGPDSDIISVFVDEVENEQQLTVDPDGNIIEAETPNPDLPRSGSLKPPGANFYSTVTRLLGVNKTEGAVSTPQTIVAFATISTLAFYAVDLTLFEASLSSRFIGRLKMIKLLFK